MTHSASQSPWGHFVPSGWRAAWLGILHRLPEGNLCRRLALWFRSPLKRTLPEIVDAEVWGLKLRLQTRGNLSEQRLLLMPQYLDAAERKVLAGELKPGSCFFDVGANIGVYSLWVAQTCGPQVRIEAFEPDPDLCGRLRFNLATNGLAHVHLNPLALGDHEGAVKLISGGGNKGENRVEATGAGATVPMTTLPSFLSRENITRIDALKIDVEGHETDVLTPLFQHCPRSVWPRLLICEVTHDDTHQLAELLAANGYTLAASGRLNGIYRLGPS
jgi:FkbM family methyltransferase